MKRLQRIAGGVAMRKIQNRTVRFSSLLSSVGYQIDVSFVIVDEEMTFPSFRSARNASMIFFHFLINDLMKREVRTDLRKRLISTIIISSLIRSNNASVLMALSSAFVEEKISSANCSKIRSVSRHVDHHVATNSIYHGRDV